MKLFIPRHAEKATPVSAPFSMVWYRWFRDLWNAFGYGDQIVYSDLHIPASSMRGATQFLRDVALTAHAANDVAHNLGVAPDGFRVVRDQMSHGSCEVYLGANQSVNTSSFTPIQLDTEAHDDGGNFDNATNYDFTAPHDGEYDISFAARFDSLADGATAILRLTKGAAELYRTPQIAGGAAATMAIGATLTGVRLDAADVLQIEAWHNHGSARNLLLGNNNTYLQIRAIRELADGQAELSAANQKTTLRLYSSCDRTVSLEVFTKLEDGATVDNQRSVAMADGEDSYAFCDVRLPNDYKPGTDLSLYLDYAPTDATAGNVRWTIDYDSAANGEALDASNAALKNSTAPGVADQITRVEFDDIDGTSLARGSIVTLRVRRQGSNVGDTYAAPVSLFGVGLKYQRQGVGWETVHP